MKKGHIPNKLRDIGLPKIVMHAKNNRYFL